jgi:hypothetical protein
MLNRLVIVLVAVLGLGCNQRPAAEYWITGLTLPSGSTVISRQETEGGKTLMVEFDNPSEWKAVQAHFDKCLASEGYVNIWRKAALQGKSRGSVEEAAAQLTQTYVKEKAPFAAMLADSVAVWREGAALAGEKPDPELKPGARYMLTITKMSR